ncbi:hypothetical protein EJ04DRAFT_575886 [Polyplosphaeria fusca]|uniref:Uncharacterized protein n=1 Tax=Polyplosphaeria fusca TaxID=682080 RepID=A0A9P4V415_9PLEO|nr:hypothetical protein EJ04DRAFT_575886 [Polyplosphaeria fusca]
MLFCNTIGIILLFLVSHALSVKLSPLPSLDLTADAHAQAASKREANFTGDLDLRDFESFFWGAPAGDNLIYANLTVYFPEQYEYIIAMEQFSGKLKSVNCAEDMMLEFINDAAFEYAKVVWNWVNQDVNNSFIMVTNYAGCADDMERLPFVVSNIRYDEVANKAFLTADLREWEEIAHSYTLNVGHMPLTPVHRAMMERGILQRSPDLTMNLGSSFDQNLFSTTVGGWTTSVDAVIRTAGSLNVDFDIDVSWLHIKSASMTVNPVDVAASIQLALTESGTLSSAWSWQKTIISIPIEGIEIAKVVKLGAFLDVDVGFTMDEWSGEAVANLGARAQISNSAIVVVDLVNSANNQFSGWTPSFSPIPLTLNAKIAGSAEVYAQPNVKLEASALGKGWNVALNFKMPYIQADFEAMYSTTGVCDTKKTLGVDIDANIGVELNVAAATKGNEASPFWSHELYSNEWPLFSKCFAFGPSNAQTGEAVDPNPAKTKKPKSSKTKKTKTSATKKPKSTKRPSATKTPSSSHVEPTSHSSLKRASHVSTITPTRSSKRVSRTGSDEPTEKATSKASATASDKVSSKMSSSFSALSSDSSSGDETGSSSSSSRSIETNTITTTTRLSTVESFTNTTRSHHATDEPENSGSPEPSLSSALGSSAPSTTDSQQSTGPSGLAPTSSEALSTSPTIITTSPPSSFATSTSTSSSVSSTSSAESCPITGCPTCKDSKYMDAMTRDYFGIEIEEDDEDDEPSNLTVRAYPFHLQRRATRLSTRKYTFVCGDDVSRKFRMAYYPTTGNVVKNPSKYNIPLWYQAATSTDCIEHEVTKTMDTPPGYPTNDIGPPHEIFAAEHIYEGVFILNFLNHLHTSESLSCSAIDKLFFTPTTTNNKGKNWAMALMESLGSATNLNDLVFLRQNINGAKARILDDNNNIIGHEVFRAAPGTQKLELMAVAGRALSYLSQPAIGALMRDTAARVEDTLDALVAFAASAENTEYATALGKFTQAGALAATHRASLSGFVRSRNSVARKSMSSWAKVASTELAATTTGEAHVLKDRSRTMEFLGALQTAPPRGFDVAAYL